MSTLLNRAHRGLFAAVIGLLCLSYLSPIAALAYGEQVAGDSAVIASSDGSGAALRETVGYDSAVLSTLTDQTPVSILEGPTTADDGSLWYLVSADGVSGWVDASFITSSAPVNEEPVEDVPAEEEVPAEDVPVEDEVPAEEIPAEEDVSVETGDTGTGVEEAPAIPWQDPIDYGVVVNNIQDGSFPDVGLACRPATDENTEPLYRYSLGETVEVTGAETWVGDFAWLPVNCAGVGGFVKSLYVQVGDVVTEEPVETEVTEVVETEVAEEPTDVVTEEVVEEPAGDVSEEVADVVTEEAPVEDVVTDEATEEVPAEDVVTEEVATEETPAEEATTEDVTVEEGNVEDPSSEEAPVDDAVTEEVTEEAVTEGEDTTDAEGEGEAADESTDGYVTPNGVKVKIADTPDLAQSIGSAEVQDTNGDGLACRTSPSSDAPVVTVLSEGTVVQVTEQTNGEWLQIVCGDTLGYASTAYLWSGGAGENEDPGFSAAANGTATVTGTGGDGVRCRTGASTGSSIIMVVREGASVTTTGAASGGWVPVTCGGQNGYIYADYLTGGSSTPAPTDPGNGGGTAGNATVTGTNGDGVRCRTGAGTSSSIITVLAEGTSVSTRGSSSNGWTPVTCGGQNGYVSSQYLTVSGGGGGSTPTPAPTDPGSGATGSAKVTGTNGDGVRCRTGAGTSSSIITVLAEGTSVSTRGAASGGWTPVTCGGQNGYVSSQYLTVSGNGSTPTPPPTDPGNGGGSLAAEDHAKVTSTLNLRYSPSMTAGIATTAPTGTVVKITGGPENGYYKIDWDGLGGYMHGDYLVKTSDALSERGGSGSNPDPDPDPGNGGGTSTGNSLVDFAMGYLGYPYVWATHGPASFDCSGFTYWVVKNVLGSDIGTGLWTQTAAGTPVSRSNLQPGDIVFFQNTYKAGLSHVGIYIGGNQFIHAENESTGVKISDLNSNYYGSRWYGAVRLG